VPGRPRRCADRREPDARAARDEEVAGASAAHSLIALAAATFVLGATACTTPSTHSSPAQPVGLLGVDWILDASSLATQVAKVPTGIRIDLTFSGEQVSGSSGCNTYGGLFQAIGGSISLGALHSTQMACDHQVMEAEAAYLRALEGSTAYEATSTTLHLTGGAADLSFIAATAASVSPSASPTQ
jgi:heat shock protein HslJ